jgi:hypothetical protein
MQTDGTLQRDQVLKTAEMREGENIFRSTSRRCSDRLQQLAAGGRSAGVRKIAGEIDIRLTERKPIAWITSDKQISDPFASDVAFLVDARGVLMKEKKLLPEYLGLPLITGCTSESLEPGKVVESFEAKAALELAASEHAQLHADALSDSRDRCFERLLPACFGQEPHRVTFGFR